MNYYIIEPEVAGGWGKNTVVTDRSVHPPQVSRLHYHFDGWLGNTIADYDPMDWQVGQGSAQSQWADHRRSQQQSTAVPLKDNKGNVVNGANGDPALVPNNFDVRAVVNAGATDLTLRVAAPVVGDVTTAADLARFDRGGKWDLQRLSGNFDPRYIDSATILIGMYAASAGISRDKILSIENFIARKGKYANGTAMDSQYTHLPERNVRNTDIGMQLILSGAIN